jgi:hypothetical protein
MASSAGCDNFFNNTNSLIQTLNAWCNWETFSIWCMAGEKVLFLLEEGASGP